MESGGTQTRSLLLSVSLSHIGLCFYTISPEMDFWLFVSPLHPAHFSCFSLFSSPWVSRFSKAHLLWISSKSVIVCKRSWVLGEENHYLWTATLLKPRLVIDVTIWGLFGGLTERTISQWTSVHISQLTVNGGLSRGQRLNGHVDCPCSSFHFTRHEQLSVKKFARPLPALYLFCG